MFTINLRQWSDQQAYLCLGIKHAYNLNRAGSLPSISHHRLNMTLITTVDSRSHHQILIGNLVCSKLFTGLTFASPFWKKKCVSTFSTLSNVIWRLYLASKWGLPPPSSPSGFLGNKSLPAKMHSSGFRCCTEVTPRWQVRAVNVRCLLASVGWLLRKWEL